MDFGIWGQLGEAVIKLAPRTLEELKSAILQANLELPTHTVVKTLLNIEPRLRKCLTQNGGHFESTL